MNVELSNINGIKEALIGAFLLLLPVYARLAYLWGQNQIAKLLEDNKKTRALIRETTEAKQ